MPVSATVRERCRALLRPGDNIRYIFPALAVHSPGVAHFLIAVTERSIVVISTRFFNRDQPESVYAVHPRHTRLGPLSLSLGPTIELGGTLFEIDEEYAAVVAAADAEVFAPEILPADPLPDL
ncbi:hypothetical protein HNP84_001376 [Thermocatellispora tengchongensis]|uniref:Uncharacterized protein n=1 Tax=Thermocatellispora tengchongensis TaxID=1073253 RepID=A0A840P153_9ACTN|nr:hypothetical protein [Thermocatellispora tengchongensis]MBB5131663.1 hypothetical protein [Thermocatellispora tengchongensis]